MILPQIILNNDIGISIILNHINKYETDDGWRVWEILSRIISEIGIEDEPVENICLESTDGIKKYYLYKWKNKR